MVVLRSGALCLSVLALLTGTFLFGRVGWFLWRSHHVGAALVRQEEAFLDASSSGCGPTAAGVQGLLVAPSIGLRAPVVQGASDAQLDVAVGHEPATAWPGAAGTAVLAAHDVTWFSGLERLRVGEEITYSTPCRVSRYQVTGARVVQSGSPLRISAPAALVLVTCYPLDALFLTPQRYVLEAKLVSSTVTRAPLPVLPSLPPVPSVPAPPALAAQNLSLANNEIPLGTLTLTGSPSLAWRESPQPLVAEQAVLSSFFGAVRSAEQKEPTWWNALAPGLSMAVAEPLEGARMRGRPPGVSPTLDVSGVSLVAGGLSARIELVGGPRPGAYDLVMGAHVNNGRLLITSWQMWKTG